MTQLVLAPSFKRAYRKVAKRDRAQQLRIEQTILTMAEDIFAPQLGTHKLSGKLAGLWACSCGYDCRIVFEITREAESDTPLIILLDIGTHDEVY